MSVALFQRALQLEEAEPERALALYKTLESENTSLYKDVLLVAIGCPILASVLAFFACRATDWHESLTIILIIGGLGFFPPILMFHYRLLQKGFQHPGWLLMLVFAAGSAFLLLIANAVALAIDVIIAGLVAGAVLIPLSFVLYLVGGISSFLLPAELPLYVFLPVFVPILVLVMAQGFSEVELMPIFPLRRFLVEIPAGLRRNWEKTAMFVASVGASFALVGSGPLGLLHEHLYAALLANGLAGALLGVSISRPERDLLLANLIRLGQARCLLALRRTAEVRRPLKMVAKSPSFSRPEAVEYLAAALGEIHAGRPASEYLHHAAEAGELMVGHRDIWLASYSRTRSLAGLEEHSKRRQPSRRRRVQRRKAAKEGKYLGIGRVLATGYACQKGVPRREYHRDNPTGYMTGQWIDVQVAEGVMDFNGLHSEGEVIRGVWSYGGDVGIAGKPQVGDLVGYYREGYCQVWEKLEALTTAEASGK